VRVQLAAADTQGGLIDDLAAVGGRRGGGPTDTTRTPRDVRPSQRNETRVVLGGNVFCLGHEAKKRPWSHQNHQDEG